MHGGRAPQVSRAAARRVAEAKAAGVLAALVPADTPPVTDVAGELVALAGDWSRPEPQRGRWSNASTRSPGTRAAQVELWLALVDRCSRLLADMARLGIEDRVAAITERTGETIVAVIERTMAWIFAELAAGATPADVADRWRPIIARELRRLPEDDR